MSIIPLILKRYGSISTIDGLRGGVPKRKCTIGYAVCCCCCCFACSPSLRKFLRIQGRRNGTIKVEGTWPATHVRPTRNVVDDDQIHRRQHPSIIHRIGVTAPWWLGESHASPDMTMGN